MSQTLSCAFKWWARMRPDQLAVVLDGEAITYGELADWSDCVAAMLVADGLRPGDRVMICSKNSLAYVALIVAVVSAGGIVGPVNFRYTAREIAEFGTRIEPSFAFAGEDELERVAAGGTSPRSLASIDALRTGESAVRIAHDPEPDAPVVIIATSGSTAAPKGVVLTNRSMTAYAAGWAIDERAFVPGARAFVLSPLNTSGGFIVLWQHLALGCTSYMESKFDPPRALALIEHEKINIFTGVPAFFELIAKLPGFATADISSLTLATVGGARVSRELLDAYIERGVVLRQLYGQTEVGGVGTLMPEHLAPTDPEKCGWGGAFMEIRVVRPDGDDCVPGEPGEILMRSPAMMKEYWGQPAETAAAIRDGWLYSGDVGVLDPAGLLTFVDRIKDLIISGGHNISAAQIERVVCEYPGIVEALAIAAPDAKFGETPLVVYHGPEEVNVGELIGYCNANLSDYKVPRYLAFSAEPLPRLASGKLSKPEVRARYKEAHETLPRVR